MVIREARWQLGLTQSQQRKEVNPGEKRRRKKKEEEEEKKKR